MARVEASDGVELYAEAHGEGVPLVFSCAYCTTHENWRSQVAPLVAAGARVILWDFRGHGESGSPEDPARYSIEQVVDDLARVLEPRALEIVGDHDVVATRRHLICERPYLPAALTRAGEAGQDEQRLAGLLRSGSDGGHVHAPGASP